MNAAGAVREGREADAPEVARLHATEIGEGLLSSLGPGFLARLYRRIVRHPRSFLLVAERNGDVVGLVAATEDPGALYRSFLLRDGLVAGAAALPRLVPRLARAVETLRWPARVGEGLPRAELLALAVAPEARGTGTGGALVRALLDELARRDVEDVRVVVGPGYPAARRVYERAGFRPAAMVTLHAGTYSEVLTWSS